MPRKNTPHAPAQITPAGGIKKEVDPVSGTETAPEPKPTRGTVGALVTELLLNPDLTYAEIVTRVMAAHPQAQTSSRSVASTAAVLRKGGTQVPTRRKPKHNKATAKGTSS